MKQNIDRKIPPLNHRIKKYLKDGKTDKPLYIEKYMYVCAKKESDKVRKRNNKGWGPTLQILQMAVRINDMDF